MTSKYRKELALQKEIDSNPVAWQTKLDEMEKLRQKTEINHQEYVSGLHRKSSNYVRTLHQQFQ